MQDIKLDIVNFLLSLCEGYEKKILGRLANRCQVFFIEEFIINNIKKLFIREKIKSGEALAKCKEMNHEPEYFGFVKRGNVYFERACEMDEPAELTERIKSDRMKSSLSQSNLNQSVISMGEREESVYSMQGGKADEVQLTVFGETKLSDDDIDCDIIKGRLEDFIEISDWEKDLFDYYVRSLDFCERRNKSKYQKEGKHIFTLIFKMYSLWMTLAKESKKHQYRLNELITQSNEYHGDFDNQQIVGVVRSRNLKKDSIYRNFFPIFI